MGDLLEFYNSTVPTLIVSGTEKPTSFARGNFAFSDTWVDPSTEININIEEIIKKRLSDIYSPEISLLTKLFIDVELRLKNIEERDGKIITIQNLRSKKFSLKMPLYVRIEYDLREKLYFVNSDDLNIWGYGETDQLAIKNFCLDVEDFYTTLSAEKKLGNDFKEKFDFLKDVIKAKK